MKKKTCKNYINTLLCSAKLKNIVEVGTHPQVADALTLKCGYIMLNILKHISQAINFYYIANQ